MKTFILCLYFNYIICSINIIKHNYLFVNKLLHRPEALKFVVCAIISHKNILSGSLFSFEIFYFTRSILLCFYSSIVKKIYKLEKYKYNFYITYRLIIILTNNYSYSSIYIEELKANQIIETLLIHQNLFQINLKILL